ncbi:hypothetical protein ONZ45_g18781 [Pleurotus djamor]|nr:hypothetical protein ONZ45_g18781 [Pleurotus djamor]
MKESFETQSGELREWEGQLKKTSKDLDIWKGQLAEKEAQLVMWERDVNSKKVIIEEAQSVKETSMATMEYLRGQEGSVRAREVELTGYKAELDAWEASIKDFASRLQRREETATLQDSLVEGMKNRLLEKWNDLDSKEYEMRMEYEGWKTVKANEEEQLRRQRSEVAQKAEAAGAEYDGWKRVKADEEESLRRQKVEVDQALAQIANEWSRLKREASQVKAQRDGLESAKANEEQRHRVRLSDIDQRLARITSEGRQLEEHRKEYTTNLRRLEEEKGKWKDLQLEHERRISEEERSWKDRQSKEEAKLEERIAARESQMREDFDRMMKNQQASLDTRNGELKAREEKLDARMQEETQNAMERMTIASRKAYKDTQSQTERSDDSTSPPDSEEDPIDAELQNLEWNDDEEVPPDSRENSMDAESQSLGTDDDEEVRIVRLWFAWALKSNQGRAASGAEPAHASVMPGRHEAQQFRFRFESTRSSVEPARSDAEVIETAKGPKRSRSSDANGDDQVLRSRARKASIKPSERPPPPEMVSSHKAINRLQAKRDLLNQLALFHEEDSSTPLMSVNNSRQQLRNILKAALTRRNTRKRLSLASTTSATSVSHASQDDDHGIAPSSPLPILSDSEPEGEELPNDGRTCIPSSPSNRSQVEKSRPAWR